MRSAHSARSKIHLLRKSQQFQGKQLPAKSCNDKRENESLAPPGSRLQMPPCSGPHLFFPSSTGDAEGADHSSPSLESGVRSQGHILSSCHKQPVEFCLWETGNFQAFGRNLPIPTQAIRGYFGCALKSTNRSLFTSATSGQCSEICSQKTELNSWQKR